jgi:hypothetical protein
MMLAQTPCFSSGQRHAQQLAQPDILSANMMQNKLEMEVKIEKMEIQWFKF